MATVRVERCPLCEAMVAEGTLYEHQQRRCPARGHDITSAAHRFEDRREVEAFNDAFGRHRSIEFIDVYGFESLVGHAVAASRRSPCRSKRGAVVFRVASPLCSTGYNTRPGCDGSLTCKASCRKVAIHAEQMAILRAERRQCRGAELLHVKTVDGRLVASGAPTCVECSKLALYVGIVAVWLFHEDGWRRYPIEQFHQVSEAEALRATR